MRQILWVVALLQIRDVIQDGRYLGIYSDLEIIKKGV